MNYTAPYPFVNIQKRTLTYAETGQPLLLLRDGSSKSVRNVVENGLPLGRFPSATYSSPEVPLNAGDRALLYADGFPETTNPAGVEFGTDCIRPFLRRNKAPRQINLPNRLLEETHWSARGSAEELDDDITMVAVHVKN
jgi:phosphoserine phosphatase RsbU/P